MRSTGFTKKTNNNQVVTKIAAEEKESKPLRDLFEDVRATLHSILATLPVFPSPEMEAKDSTIDTIIQHKLETFYKLENKIIDYIHAHPTLSLTPYYDFLPHLAFFGSKAIIKIMNTRAPFDYYHLVTAASFSTPNHDAPHRFLMNGLNNKTKTFLSQFFYVTFKADPKNAHNELKYIALDSILLSRRNKLNSYLFTIITDKLKNNQVTTSEFTKSLVRIAENYSAELLKLICSIIGKANYPHQEIFQTLQQGLMLAVWPHANATSDAMRILLFLYADVGGSLNINVPYPAMYHNPTDGVIKKVTISTHLIYLAIIKNEMDTYKLIADQLEDFGSVPPLNISEATDACDLQPILIDDLNSRPLHIAVKTDNPEIIKDLLARPGTDCNAQTLSGLTPLMIAIKFGRINAVNLLCTAGADPLIENSLPEDQNTARKLAKRVTMIDLSSNLVKSYGNTQIIKDKNTVSAQILNTVHRHEILARINQTKPLAENKPENKPSEWLSSSSITANTNVMSEKNLQEQAEFYASIIRASYKTLIECSDDREQNYKYPNHDKHFIKLLNYAEKYKSNHNLESLPETFMQTMRAIYPYLGYFGISYQIIDKINSVFGYNIVDMATIVSYATLSHKTNLNSNHELNSKLFPRLRNSSLKFELDVLHDESLSVRRTALRSSLMTGISLKIASQGIPMSEFKEILTTIAENQDVNFLSNIICGLRSILDTAVRDAYFDTFFAVMAENVLFKQMVTSFKPQLSPNLNPQTPTSDNVYHYDLESSENTDTNEPTPAIVISTSVSDPLKSPELKTENTSPTATYFKPLQTLLREVSSALKLQYDRIQTSKNDFEDFVANIATYETSFDYLFTPVNKALKNQEITLDPTHYDFNANTTARLGYLGLTHLVQKFITVEHKLTQPILLDFMGCIHIFSGATPLHYDETDFKLNKTLNRLRPYLYLEFPSGDITVHPENDNALMNRRKEIRAKLLPLIKKHFDRMLVTSKSLLTALTVAASNNDVELFEFMVNWLQTPCSNDVPSYESINLYKMNLRQTLFSFLLKCFYYSSDSNCVPLKLTEIGKNMEIGADIYINLLRSSDIPLNFTAPVMLYDHKKQGHIAIMLSPLHIVAMTGEKDLFELVRKRFGDHIDQRASLYQSAGNEPTFTALKLKHATIVDSDLTPLHLASAYCHATIIESLVQHGASIHSKTAGGSTPIQLLEDILKVNPPLAEHQSQWNRVIAKLSGSYTGTNSITLSHSERITKLVRKNKIAFKESKIKKLSQYLETSEAKHEKSAYSISNKAILIAAGYGDAFDKLRLPPTLRVSVESLVEITRTKNNVAKAILDHMLNLYRLELPSTHPTIDSTDSSPSPEQPLTPSIPLPSPTPSPTDEIERENKPEVEIEPVTSPSEEKCEKNESAQIQSPVSITKQKSPSTVTPRKRDKISTTINKSRNNTSRVSPWANMSDASSPSSAQSSSTSPSSSSSIISNLSLTSPLGRQKSEEDELLKRKIEKLSLTNKEILLLTKEQQNALRIATVQAQLDLKKQQKKQAQEAELKAQLALDEEISRQKAILLARLEGELQLDEVVHELMRIDVEEIQKESKSCNTAEVQPPVIEESISTKTVPLDTNEKPIESGGSEIANRIKTITYNYPQRIKDLMSDRLSSNVSRFFSVYPDGMGPNALHESIEKRLDFIDDNSDVRFDFS